MVICLKQRADDLHVVHLSDATATPLCVCFVKI